MAASKPSLPDRIASWAAVLTGAAHTSEFWAGGAIPPLLAERFAGGKLMPGNRTWRGACPSTLHRPNSQSSAPFCRDYWPRANVGASSCLAISIGIGDEWSFEDNAVGGIKGARQPPTACEVHAYDATRDLREKHASHAVLHKEGSHLHFHYGGLRGELMAAGGGGGGGGGDTRNTYGTIDSAMLHTLGELLVRDAGGAAPDILKVDCEGCEWGAFTQIASASPALMGKTRLLLLELHVSTMMVPPTPEQFVRFFDFLMSELGFKLWYVRNNRGRMRDRRVVDFLKAVLPPDQCCYEIALVRG